jgi:ABC-type bacteriocin/lantibiotic exporter with double-glycine peptidase domain
MLTTDNITAILTECCLLLNKDLPGSVIRSLSRNHRSYETKDLVEFNRDLSEAARRSELQILEYALSKEQLEEFLNYKDQVILLYRSGSKGYVPCIITPSGRQFKIIYPEEATLTVEIISKEALLEQHSGGQQLIVMSVMKLEPLAGKPGSDEKKLKPWERFLHLLLTERKDIFYILVYAVFIGLISLVIPLGIQTTIELISGGLFFSSVYVMIGAVIAGVLISGGMQVFQLSLVEYLQRRIFARAAFEFAYRLPRLDTSSIQNVYAPGLVNRFLDVLTIQKGLPKFLIEFSGAALQIIFGLLLLSLYHPLFVMFALILVALLTAIFYLSGPKALTTSLEESSYKYKLLHWLEDLARMNQTIKLTGTTNLPISKTDYYVNNYLKNRKSHFRILLVQFTYIVIFKAAIIGGLLIIGTILVVEREITLGQFVASEVIIILILNSVEKIIMYMDVIYDLLTAVDKIGAVTDLPIERQGGLDMPDTSRAFSVELHELHYQKSEEKSASILSVSLRVEPNEKVCIAGNSGSGMIHLAEILAGTLSDYTGSVLINGFGLRDLDLTYFRDHISANGTTDDLFEGTLIDNILVGNPKIQTTEAIRVLEQVGLEKLVAGWSLGIDTPLPSEGKGLNPELAHRIILARCLARKPRLMLFHDHFSGITAKEKSNLFKNLISNLDATLICFSADPVIMANCDRVIVLENGTVKTSGSYTSLVQNGLLANII